MKRLVGLLILAPVLLLGQTRTLNTLELADYRGEMQKLAEQRGFPINYTKPQVNAAFQALENRFETVRPGFYTAIEVAAPGIFSNLQKRAIFKIWLSGKAGVE